MRQDQVDQLVAWTAKRTAGESVEPFIVPKTFIPEIKAEGDPADRKRLFIITDAGIDRDGDTVAMDGWNLKNYKRNPVVLWAHDYSFPPIAKSLSCSSDGKALRSLDEFAPPEIFPFADTILRLIDGGYLRATSVGFMPTKWTFNEDRGGGGWGPAIDFLEQEMLEHSIVPVPSNPRALIDAKAKGINLAPIRDWAERALDEWSEERGLWLSRSAIEEAMKVMANKTVHAGIELKLPNGQVLADKAADAPAMTEDEFDALSDAEKLALAEECDQVRRTAEGLGLELSAAWLAKDTWSTAYKNALPDSAFAFIEAGGEKDADGKTTPRSLRHFPHHDKDGTPDEAHVRNAAARIPQSDVSDEGKKKAEAHIKRHERDLGIGDDDGGKSVETIDVPIRLTGDAELLKALGELVATKGRQLTPEHMDRLQKAHDACKDGMESCAAAMDHVRAVLEAANSETDLPDDNINNPLDATDPDNDGDGDVNGGGRKGEDPDVITIGESEFAAKDFVDIIRGEVRGELARLTGRLEDEE